MIRVAVVEDNPDNRFLVRALLEDRYAVEEFEDAESAIAAFAAAPPDVALLDISLPGMDGVALLTALRADPRTASVPVVALTAHAMAGDEAQFRAAGFNAYVSKPILDDALLFSAIEAALAAR